MVASLGTLTELVLFHMYFHGKWNESFSYFRIRWFMLMFVGTCAQSGLPDVDYATLDRLNLIRPPQVHICMWIYLALSVLWLISSITLLTSTCCTSLAHISRWILNICLSTRCSLCELKESQLLPVRLDSSGCISVDFRFRTRSCLWARLWCITCKWINILKQFYPKNIHFVPFFTARSTQYFRERHDTCGALEIFDSVREIGGRYHDGHLFPRLHHLGDKHRSVRLLLYANLQNLRLQSNQEDDLESGIWFVDEQHIAQKSHQSKVCIWCENASAIHTE